MSFPPARWRRHFWAGIENRLPELSGGVFHRHRGRGTKRRSSLPNCGKRGLDDAPSIECGGDRVLVEKFIYEFRRPRRWEVAVFHFPGEPSQAYVKRVVGLPGDVIRIKGGDVFANGQLARKSLAEIRAMRMLVHDSRFQPEDASRYPRWVFRSDASGGSSPTAWSREGNRFVHSTARNLSGCGGDDWIVYQHWDAGRGGFGTMTDFHGYNGNEPHSSMRSKTSPSKRSSR